MSVHGGRGLLWTSLGACLLAFALASLSAPPPLADDDRLDALLTHAENRFRAEDFAAACTVAADLEAPLPGDRTDAASALAARARLLSGHCAYERGDDARGAAELARAAQLARESADPRLAAAVELGLGEVAWRRAEYARVEERVRRARERSAAAGDLRGEALALELLARSHYKHGRYAEADAAFSQSLRACETLADEACAARALAGLALSALDRRDFGRAEGRFADAVERWRAAGEPFGESEALALTAALHLFQGTDEKAREWALAALAVAVRGAEPAAEARARQLLGHAERARGRPAEALVQMRRTAELRRQTGCPREEAWARAGGAQAMALAGDPAARDELGRALELWRGVADRRALAWHLLEAARLDATDGRPAAAAGELAQAEALAAAIELPYLSEILRERSRLLAAAGDVEGAVASARRAVAAARDSANPEMLWRALIDLASAAAASGRSGEAREAVEEALGLLERLRTVALPSEEGRIASLERMQDAYETAISVLFDLGQGQEALLVAEHARARALLERRGTPPAATTGEVAAIAQRSRVAILELFCGRDRLFLWAVSPSGRIVARAVPIDREHLAARIREATSGSERDPDASTAAWRELSALVLEPMAEFLQPERAPLAIAAHGPLLRLSFGALVDAAGSALLDRRPVFTIPSIGFLRDPPERRSFAEGRVVLLADPEPPPVPGRDLPLPRLPGARREAAAVAAMFPTGRVSLLVGGDASEERLAALGPGAAILHLAAHGLVDDREPLGGRLALAASAGADGLWTAREALELPLHAELVVLSACGGGGGLVAGEGVLGFGHALLGAGAQSVVASLWSVPDEVAAYEVERFYGALLRGADRSSALRSAALDTRSALAAGRFSASGGRPLAPEPRFWAAFVLLGRPG